MDNRAAMRVDHLVWYTADLAEGDAFFASRMDCRPVFGGIHPGEGTRNRLLALSDETYVEILGRDPAQPEASLDTEIRDLSAPGLYHWAASGAGLADLRARTIAAGLTGGELVRGGRTLPNGKRLDWKLFGLRNHEFGALVPFFIDWMDSEHPARTAPRGGSLLRIEAFSPEAEKLQAIYAILGLDVVVTSAAVPAMTVTIASSSGEHQLEMIHPVPRGYVI